MEDIYEIVSRTGGAWNVTHSDRESFEVTEFWKTDITGSITVDKRSVGPDPEERQRWLTQRRRESQSLILRLAWLTVDVEKQQVDISKPVEKEILKEFGIQLAHRYFKTFTSGITALPKTCAEDTERQAFAFCFAPKLASLWSHSRSKARHPDGYRAVTEGIVYIKAASRSKAAQPEAQKPPSFQNIISQIPWDPRVCQSPAVPALMLSLLLGQQIQQTQTAIIQEIKKVEVRTGHHDFHHQNQPAPDELSLLSARLSGFAARLASVSRKTTMVGELLSHVRSIQDSESKQRGSVDTTAEVAARDLEAAKLLQHNVQVLQHRLDMQSLETDFILKRVEVQLKAVFHLIAQHDSMSNLIISSSSRDLAKASHVIASYSYRDSSSMKTLAIVTMLFLPGSFVSALFSTDFFAWDEVDRTRSDIGIPMTPQLTLYWVITIPLTVLTFVLYFMWFGYQKARNQQDLDELSEVTTASAGVADAERTRSDMLSDRQLTVNAAIEKQRMLVARSSTMSNYNQTMEV